MWPYFFVLLSVTILCYYAEQFDYCDDSIDERGNTVHSASTRALYGTVAIILIFVAGMRYKIGTDYGSYYQHYKSYIIDLPDKLRTLNEPGFGVIAWIASKIYDDGAAVMFTASFVTILLPILVIYRNTKMLLISTLLYVVMCWHGAFNGVAQYLAASMLFCGMGALKNKDYLKFVLVLFVAFLFHRTVLFMVVLPFLANRKINVKNIILLIVLTCVALFLYDRIFSIVNTIMDTSYSLTNSYTSRNVNRIRVISAVLPAIVFLIEYWGTELSDDETFYLNMSIIHSVICVIAMNSALLYRMSIYTAIFQGITIANLLKNSSEKNRNILTWGLVGMYVAMWLYEIYTYPSLSPFRWIWNR